MVPLKIKNEIQVHLIKDISWRTWISSLDVVRLYGDLLSSIIEVRHEEGDLSVEWVMDDFNKLTCN